MLLTQRLISPNCRNGLSCLNPDKVITALKEMGRSDILVIAGGVIPKQDHDFLYEAGVSGIFGPGTIIAKSAIAILEKLS